MLACVLSLFFTTFYFANSFGSFSNSFYYCSYLFRMEVGVNPFSQNAVSMELFHKARNQKEMKVLHYCVYGYLMLLEIDYSFYSL
jgi:hypothetical protein